MHIYRCPLRDDNGGHTGLSEDCYVSSPSEFTLKWKKTQVVNISCSERFEKEDESFINHVILLLVCLRFCESCFNQREGPNDNTNFEIFFNTSFPVIPEA